MSFINGNGTPQPLKEINSPFRYAGGKFYARKLILGYLPPHEYYMEPFAGGASIFFAKPRVHGNWLNDIDEEVVNCYIHIRDHVRELTERLRPEVASKERHTYYKNEFVPCDALDRAVRWYYLNRTSYSGIMVTQNCFWGYGDKYSMRPENWPRNLARCSDKLQGVRLTGWDFERVIDGAPDGAFLFVDPPYFNSDQDKFYVASFCRDDHLRLREALKRNVKRTRFLLTYDDAEEIREMYSGCHIAEEQWNYTIGRTDDQTNGTNGTTPKNPVGKRQKGREIFITNYPPGC